METVREWAGSVCCACVIGAMLSMVSPGGGSKRMFGTVITLMTMCVLFRPVSAARELALDIRNYSFDVSQYENSELESEMESSAKSVYASYLEENLRRVLDGAGIHCKSIAVMMDNSEDGRISIGQVEVIVKNEDVDLTEKVKELLRGYIGIEPVVTAR